MWFYGEKHVEFVFCTRVCMSCAWFSFRLQWCSDKWSQCNWENWLIQIVRFELDQLQQKIIWKALSGVHTVVFVHAFANIIACTCLNQFVPNANWWISLRARNLFSSILLMHFYVRLANCIRYTQVLMVFCVFVYQLNQESKCI